MPGLFDLIIVSKNSTPVEKTRLPIEEEHENFTRLTKYQVKRLYVQISQKRVGEDKFFNNSLDFL